MVFYDWLFVEGRVGLMARGVAVSGARCSSRLPIAVRLEIFLGLWTDIFREVPKVVGRFYEERVRF